MITLWQSLLFGFAFLGGVVALFFALAIRDLNRPKRQLPRHWTDARRRRFYGDG